VTRERKAWLVMLTAFLAGVAVAVNQFKVPPVLPILMATLQLDMVTGGWMMSVYSLASVVLALPAAFLVARLGPKRTGMIGLGCTIAGSAAGALAGSATALLVARIVEGISAGLIAVAVPSVISLWFEPRKRGLPMGIWAAWVPLGNVTMFNAAHPLLATFGWRAIWWFGALLALTFLVIFSLVVTVPRRARQVGDRIAGSPTFSRPVLLNPASTR
jgi:MFS family permease